MKKKYFFRKIIFLFLFFSIIQNVNSQNSIFDSISNEISKIAIYNKTKSLEMLQDLYQIAYNNPDSSLLIAHCLYKESLLNLRQRIVDSLLPDKIGQRLERKYLPIFEQALLQSALGNSLILEGKYAEAFPLHLQAVEIFKQSNNNYFIAKTLNSLGNICRYIDLLSLAEYYHSEALTYTTPDYYEYYLTKMSIFMIQAYDNKMTCIDSLKYLSDIVEKKKFEELLPVLYLNLGSLLLDDFPEKALIYYYKIQDLEFDNPAMTSALFANVGFYCLNNKDYAKALYYFKNAQKIMEENNDFYNLPHLYNDISSIYEQQKDYKNALLYSRKNQELTLKIRSNIIAIETHQKYITTFLETSNNKLIIAEQTIKLKNRQFVFIAMVAVFTLLVVLLFLLYTHQQKLRKASENRELSTKLEHEKRVQQYEKRQRKLEKEKQEATINAKIRDISSYSMLVSNKNQILKQIGEFTSQIFDNKENTVKIAKKIDEIIHQNLSIDDEWENFKMHFVKVHPHFFKKLKQHSSELTEENLRMCAYIKMRMTTKQIAQLLHVIPNSIITNRYRLKKKLQLADNEELDEFIGNL
jgi:tetratricopeptide (TPR) repeat protein